MSSDEGLQLVPHSKFKTKGDCAFEVVAPKLWSSLLLYLDIFKKQLKTV